eukprot:403354910
MDISGIRFNNGFKSTYDDSPGQQCLSQSRNSQISPSQPSQLINKPNDKEKVRPQRQRGKSQPNPRNQKQNKQELEKQKFEASQRKRSQKAEQKKSNKQIVQIQKNSIIEVQKNQIEMTVSQQSNQAPEKRKQQENMEEIKSQIPSTLSSEESKQSCKIQENMSFKPQQRQIEVKQVQQRQRGRPKAQKQVVDQNIQLIKRNREKSQNPEEANRLQQKLNESQFEARNQKGKRYSPIKSQAVRGMRRGKRLLHQLTQTLLTSEDLDLLVLMNQDEINMLKKRKFDQDKFHQVWENQLSQKEANNLIQRGRSQQAKDPINEQPQKQANQRNNNHINATNFKIKQEPIERKQSPIVQPKRRGRPPKIQEQPKNRQSQSKSQSQVANRNKYLIENQKQEKSRSRNKKQEVFSQAQSRKPCLKRQLSKAQNPKRKSILNPFKRRKKSDKDDEPYVAVRSQKQKIQMQEEKKELISQAAKLAAQLKIKTETQEKEDIIQFSNIKNAKSINQKKNMANMQLDLPQSLSENIQRDRNQSQQIMVQNRANAPLQNNFPQENLSRKRVLQTQFMPNIQQTQQSQNGLIYNTQPNPFNTTFINPNYNPTVGVNGATIQNQNIRNSSYRSKSSDINITYQNTNIFQPQELILYHSLKQRKVGKQAFKLYPESILNYSGDYAQLKDTRRDDDVETDDNLVEDTKLNLKRELEEKIYIYQSEMNQRGAADKLVRNLRHDAFYPEIRRRHHSQQLQQQQQQRQQQQHGRNQQQPLQYYQQSNVQDDIDMDQNESDDQEEGQVDDDEHEEYEVSGDEDHQEQMQN